MLRGYQHWLQPDKVGALDRTVHRGRVIRQPVAHPSDAIFVLRDSDVIAPQASASARRFDSNVSLRD
jgi:hypothetical protein